MIKISYLLRVIFTAASYQICKTKPAISSCRGRDIDKIWQQIFQFWNLKLVLI